MLAYTAVSAVTILAVLLLVLVLVYYLVSVILELQRITNGLEEVIAHVGEIVQKSAPVNDVVTNINEQLDAGVDLLEGLLVKKAGLTDAVGLVEGLYAGASAAGFRSFPESTTITAPRIGEVYTRGTLTLARLGREAPIAAGNPAGPALRDIERGSLAARQLYPEIRQTRPESLPRSPVIGTDAPVQYEQREDIGAPRKRLPGSHGLRREEPVQTPASFEYERATSVEGAIASLQRLGPEARVIAGGHSLLPMMKLRLANPEHLIDINDLKELSYIREEGGEIADRGADPPCRAAQVRAARRAPAALSRRRERDRRSGRAQPRHDRRLALPGGRGRGPLGRLLGGEGEGRDPRRRGRAGGRRWRSSTSAPT